MVRAVIKNTHRRRQELGIWGICCFFCFFPFYLLKFLLQLIFVFPLRMCKRMRLPRLKRTKPIVNATPVVDNIGESWLGCFSCLYHRLCCKLDFREIPVLDAIKRYSEEKPVSFEKVLRELSQNNYINTVLQAINTHSPSFFFKILPTGSIRERFGKSLPSTSILATDFDLMLVPDGVEVREAQTDDTQDSKAQIFPPVFETVDDLRENTTKPGYVWLRLVENRLHHWYKLSYQRLTNAGVQSFLSQLAVYNMIENSVMSDDNVLRLLKRKENEGKVTVSRNGPAITIVIAEQKSEKQCFKTVTREEEVFHVDFTFALYCPEFPRKALGFFKKRQGSSQSNYPWPNQFVVEKIAAIGCHVVPKPSSKSLTFYTPEQITNSYLAPGTAIEWRYSFSQAEITLSDHLPLQARTAFLAFKALIKVRINTHVHRSGEIVEIPSYVLKTILLKLTERKPASYWVDKIEVEFFGELLSELIECVEAGVCTMYWIEEINLLDDVFAKDPESRQTILARLKEYNRRPNLYLVDNWLEYQRCVRLNCCSCLFPAKQVATVVNMEKDLKRWGCCSIPCSYTGDTCCFGPVPFDSTQFHVY